MSITTWRYSLPSLPGGEDSWSIVFVDSTGCVAVLSDYGDWCFRWQQRHCGHDDVRDFLWRLDADYLARKLGMGRKEELQVYDGEATRKRIREHICQYRRSGSLSKEVAREEWELAGNDLEDNGEVGFHEWYLNTSFSDAYEMASYRMSHGLHHWATVSFLRLKTLLLAELEAEKAAAPAEAAHG